MKPAARVPHGSPPADERFAELESGLRQATRTTAEALTLLETMLINAPIGFGFVDRDFRILRLNERLAADNGSTVAEQLGRTVAESIPGLWPQLEPLYRHVLETGTAVLDNEVTGVTAAEPLTIRSWSTSYYPVFVDDEVIGIGVVAVDVTERRRTERDLRFQADLLASTGQAIVATDLDGLVEYWNPAAEELYGWTAAEAVGCGVATLISTGETNTQDLVILEGLRNGVTWSGDYWVRHRDGSRISVYVTDSPMFDQDGQLVAVIAVSVDNNERRQARQRLETSVRQLAEAQSVAHFGSVESDLVTGVITRSDEYDRILGLGPNGHESSQQIISMVHPDDRPAVAARWAAAIEQGTPFDIACRIVRPDSVQRSVRFTVAPQVDGDGTVVKLMGTVLDETERIEAERVTRSAEARFEIGFQQSGIGALIVNLEGIPIRVNSAVEALLGRPESELVGHVWDEYTHPDNTPLRRIMLARAAAGRDMYSDDRRYLRPDGSVVWASAHVSLVRDDSGKPEYFYSQLQDITEQKEMEQALIHQALHDSLTGLPNRALLTDRLLHSLAQVRQRGAYLAVIFLNVDHFKQINDELSHAVGDEVLRLASERIAAAIRPGDTLARFGGDEFVVVCDNVSVVDAERIAEDVLDALCQPCAIGDQEMRINASIGIALSDQAATPES
ncbi:MAG: PAS domain S-box protein, partial [Ilumatobacteraceae bacterium]